MASGSTARVLRAPGKLLVGPTDLSAASPYGGTEIGKTKDVLLTHTSSLFRVESEGLGQATDILESDSRFVLTFTLRGWDDDAVGQLFSATTADGTASSHKVLSEPGTAVTGSSALGRAKTLLFAPDDTIHAPALLIFSGIPDWQEGGDLPFSRDAEFGIQIAVECMRNSSGNIFQLGMLNDLTLP